MVPQSRGLAERVSGDPPAIKLNFMHKTGDQDRGVDDYYLHSKENKCVSCGEEGHYLRYKVVPACYRRNFPVQWKSHRSHDIVLLCVDCHHVAHKAAEVVKKQLSQEYGVPLFPPKTQPTDGNVCETHPYNVRRAAVALKVYGKTLPEHRRQELQQMVRGFVHPGSGEASSEEWLSQEEMEAGLLAGLAPRQKRRMMRQLAVEKERELNGGNTAMEATEQPQHQGSVRNNSLTDSHDQSGSAQQDSKVHVQHDTSRHDTRQAAAPREQPAVSSESHEYARAEGRLKEEDQHDQDDSNEAVTDGQEPAGNRQGVSDEDTNGHAWHGRQVVAAVLEQGGPDALLMLIQRFRQSFSDALHPEHLPAAWHIKHRYLVDDVETFQQAAVLLVVVLPRTITHAFVSRKQALVTVLMRKNVQNQSFLHLTWFRACSANRDFGEHSIYASSSTV